MALSWPPKDPDEVLDYTIDWSDRLTGGETIITSTWTCTPDDSDLTEDSNTISIDATVIWLSAGALGTKYSLTNHIVTSAGREMDQTVNLKIKTK